MSLWLFIAAVLLSVAIGLMLRVKSNMEMDKRLLPWDRRRIALASVLMITVVCLLGKSQLVDIYHLLRL
jgi:hypothetical protein